MIIVIDINVHYLLVWRSALVIYAITEVMLIEGHRSLVVYANAMSQHGSSILLPATNINKNTFTIKQNIFIFYNTS